MEQLNNNEYNILVVEDDKEIRDGIEIFLKSQGYHMLVLSLDLQENDDTSAIRML